MHRALLGIMKVLGRGPPVDPFQDSYMADNVRIC